MPQHYQPDPNNPAAPLMPCGGQGQPPCQGQPATVPAPRPTGALDEHKREERKAHIGPILSASLKEARMTLHEELTERIASEKDLLVQVDYWQTSSQLWSAMVDYLIAAQLGFLSGTEAAQKTLHKHAYKAAYDRLSKVEDLSKFPVPK